MNKYGDKAIEILNELHTECLEYHSEYLPLIKCANRCAEYESTGLTPNQLTKAAALYKAQEEGRFAEPPCMPGDIVYTISGNIIFACEVLKIKVEAGLEYGRTTFIREKVMGWKGETPFEFDFCDFGKTVFLSREEAADALKEENNNGD